MTGKLGGSSLKVNGVACVLRTRLTELDLRDLQVIWSRDPRIPTPASRQRWAQHRGLAPTPVGRWFHRRRASHIPLAGDAATPTGSYELNPSSPSNVSPHEIPVKVQVRGSRARAVRTVRGANFELASEHTDPDPSSDDTVCYHPGLDHLAAAVETVTSGDCSGGEAPLICRGDCVLCLSAPPSPPTLWFPWSAQADTAGKPHPGPSGIGALEMTNSGL